MDDHPHNGDAQAQQSQPWAIIVGQDEYAIQIGRLLRDNLGDICRFHRFSTVEEAAAGLGYFIDEETGLLEADGDEDDSLLDGPIALLIAMVGAAGPSGDQMLRPLARCPRLRPTRFIVVSTELEVTGIDWLTDYGSLDWVGYAPGLHTEPFLASMREQVALYYDHLESAAIPHLSSLFHQPHSDIEIVEKILNRIEAALGPQPRVTWPPGVRLTTRGAWVEEVTLILSGSVALIHEGPSADIVMHEESTGRIIGLLAVSEGRRAMLNAVTTSEVTGVRLTVQQLNSAIRFQPDIALWVSNLFIRSLDRRLRRAEELHIENVELSEQLATERAQVASALSNLEDARTELAAQERMASLGTLAAGMAHELNNPTAAIGRIASFLAQDVEALLQTAPNGRWAGAATKAIEDGLKAPTLSTKAERALRRTLTELTGDRAVAQRLVLAGLRDPEMVKQLGRKGRISLDGALQAASIGTQLRSLRSASTRIAELVSSLRSYARPEEQTVSNMDLHESLDDAIRLLTHKLKGINVTRRYGEVPGIEAHPGALAQVWTNILTNAAEAISESTAEVPDGKTIGTIKVRTSVPKPGWVRVEIIDDGPGIPQEVLPHIFEPRFTTKSGQVRFGMGVGLGVCRTIVSRHHGTMRIRSSPKGTRVIVELPDVPPKEEP